MSLEDLSREQLLELIEGFLTEHDRRHEDVSARADEQARSVAELKLYQVELELQNRELRRAQLELEEARDRFSGLYELAPVAYLVLDDAGLVMSANHGAALLFRQPASALLRRSLVVLCGSSHALAQLLARCTQHEARGRTELAIPIQDDMLDLEVLVTCSRDPRTNTMAYRCALLDVSVRKRAERERDRAIVAERALHACFQALDRIHLAMHGVLSSRAPTLVADLIQLFADAVLQLFDGERLTVQLEGREFVTRRGHTHGLVAGSASMTVPLALAGRPVGELRVEFASGAPASQGQTVADYTRALALIGDRLALALELARLHDAETLERQRLEWLDRARQTLSDVSDLHDVQTAIDRCAQQARSALALDVESYVFEHDRLFSLAPERRFTRLLARWLERKVVRTSRTLTRDEAPRIFRALGCHALLILPLTSRHRVLGFLCFALAEAAPSEHVRTLEELSRLAAGALDSAQLLHELRGAVDARDTLLALVAHDLRSPLNAISLTTDSLSEPPPHEERRRSAPQLQLIQRSIQRMSHLIEDLLATAHIDAGSFAIDPRVLPAEELAHEAGELNRPAAEAKHITLQAGSSSELGAVFADRERVMQVLTNLIVNAIKFSPPHSTVGLEVAPEVEHVRYSVRDRGPGMSALQLAQVFRRYWRGKGARTGLGLGLYIAERIVSAHGGRIWAESTEGAGAAFHFTLPRKPQSS
ncbi:MAG TPA: ATP-binding protein [Polyangiales bacterium]|nr:ATP-binding protein [Polyangiales bacterium]